MIGNKGKRIFIGRGGSREESLQILGDFLARGTCDLQRVRGVSKIGKSSVVSEALCDHRSGSGERVDYLPDSNPLELGLEGMTRWFLAIVSSRGKRPPRRITQDKIRSHIEQEYDHRGKVLISVAINGIAKSHEVLWPLFLGGSTKITLKWVLEEHLNWGAINLIPPPGKPYLARPVAVVGGFDEKEVRDFIQVYLEEHTRWWRKEIVRRLESTLGKFCGGHPDLLDSVCRWLIGVREFVTRGDTWSALKTEKLITRELLLLVLINEREIGPKIKDIFEDLPRFAREELAAVVRGQAERIQSSAIQDELRNAGLVLKNWAPSVLVRFFHPAVVTRNRANIDAFLDRLYRNYHRQAPSETDELGTEALDHTAQRAGTPAIPELPAKPRQKDLDFDSRSDSSSRGIVTRLERAEVTGVSLADHHLVTNSDAEHLATPALTPQEAVHLTRPQASVFLCYAHSDNEPPKLWLNRLMDHLSPLVRQENLTVWSDQSLKVGDQWHVEIQRKLASAKVAVLLVSPAFLKSEYIANSELPVLLRRAHQDDELKILPVLLLPSVVDETRFKWNNPKTGQEEEFTLSGFQMVGTHAKTLSDMSEADQNRAFVALVRQILRIIGSKA